MTKTRLVIAEPCTLFRQGLTALLNAEPDFAVVGEAENAEETRRLCVHYKPEIALLNVAVMDALSQEYGSLLSALKVCCPWIVCVVLGRRTRATEAFTRCERVRATELGAAAYLNARVDREEMLRVLRTVRPACSERQPCETGVLSETGSAATAPSRMSQYLSGRERVIMGLIAQGLSNKEIAGRLNIGVQTVKNHISRLLEKLSLADRTQIAVYALEHPLSASAPESDSVPSAHQTVSA